MGRVGAGRWRRVRAYVAGVLELVERTALFSDSVDWDTVRLDAEEVLGRAGCYADTHTFLAAVVRQAGGRHSRLIPPKSPHASPGQVAAVLGPPVPTGRVMDAAGHPAGYLRLPRLPGGLPRARRYLATGGTLLNTLVAARPRGWIVDLRGNIGGNMWPMLAVAAPLLPDGELGHFVLPDGRHQTWTLERGRIRLDGRRMARSRGPAFREDPVPIAVLTSRRTASAGEAVASLSPVGQVSA